MLRILVVEDEVLVAFVLREGLQDLGATVTVAHSTAEATQALSKGTFAAAVIDMLLPDMNGEPFAKFCRRQCPALPIVVTTGLHGPEIRSMFPGDSYLEVIEKPHETAQVQAALERLGVVFTVTTSSAQ